MQIVRIDPPSDAQTIEIIRKGVAPALTAYHGVKFSKAVIEAAVKLSSKYITDKAQPDKSISIIDSMVQDLGLLKVETHQSFRR